MKYKLIFAYDGSKFFGYAIQKNESNTIQEIVEKNISIILNSPTKISASGRTDKGVHALNQAATFKTEKEIDEVKFLASLNKLVPNSIYFKSVKKVSENFDARFSAKSKTYLYIINLKEYDPFNRSYEIVEKDLNIEKLKACSKVFIGKHNFQNFTSRPKDENNFVREIYDIKFSKNKNKLYVRFVGNGFMTYMVRKLMGTMIEVARNRLTVTEVKEILSKEKRDIVIYTSLPKGLYLEKVKY